MADSRTKTVLVIIGLISVLRLGLRFGQPQYEVRVSLENISVDNSEHKPPVYLVKTNWFGLQRDEYPLRFELERTYYRWLYKQDGTWRGINAEMSQQIDVSLPVLDLGDYE